MSEHKIQGSDMLLFIDPTGGTNYDTVVCLTSLSQTDSVQPVDASSACGPDKSPGAVDLSISFEGQHLQDPSGGTISGTNLLLLLRAEQTIGWKLSPVTPQAGDEIQEGTGYLSELSSTYNYAEIGVFSGTIQPYGLPTVTIYNGGITGVVIGSQTWMAKNLSVTNYANGDTIPEVTDPTEWASLTTGAWCYYNNDSSTEPVYGRLYNWFAFVDPRGLMPAGWSFAYNSDYATLDLAIGSNAGELKEVGFTHWLSPNLDATNSTGFTCVPSGIRNADGTFGGTYLSQGEVCEYWVAGTAGGTDARSYGIYYDGNYLSYDLFDQNAGLSVRFIQ